MADGEWWITGGENGLDTTERLVELQSTGSRFEPAMPAQNSFHSAAAITENDVLLLNGDTDEVWLYSRADSQSEESTGEYVLLDSQSEASRIGGYAGVVTREDGTM